MKKIYLLIVLMIGLMTLTGCQEKDCTQEAYCQLISSQDYGKTTHDKEYPESWYNYLCSGEGEDAKIEICHNGQSICVSIGDVEEHLNKHGDTLGECGTLSSDGLEFRDGEIVEIPCSYALPFIHTTSNGTQWYYTKPNER